MDSSLVSGFSNTSYCCCWFSFLVCLCVFLSCCYMINFPQILFSKGVWRNVLLLNFNKIFIPFSSDLFTFWSKIFTMYLHTNFSYNKWYILYKQAKIHKDIYFNRCWFDVSEISICDFVFSSVDFVVLFQSPFFVVIVLYCWILIRLLFFIPFWECFFYLMIFFDLFLVDFFEIHLL